VNQNHILSMYYEESLYFDGVTLVNFLNAVLNADFELNPTSYKISNIVLSQFEDKRSFASLILYEFT